MESQRKFESRFSIFTVTILGGFFLYASFVPRSSAQHSGTGPHGVFPSIFGASRGSPPGHSRNGRNNGNATSQTTREITQAVTASRTGAGGNPLPVTSHWNRGGFNEAFTVDRHVDAVEQGYHHLPAAHMPRPNEVIGGKNTWSPYDIQRNEKGFKELARYQMPFSLVARQWEDWLCHSVTSWYDLPYFETPCLIDLDGVKRRIPSEVGPVEHWYALGKAVATSPAMKQLHQWYPNPPFVLLVSNNEPRLAKKEQDIRWVRGELTDPGFRKRRLEMLRGIRENLPAGWREDAKMIGYNVNPAPNFLGRWCGWLQYSGWREPGDVMNWGIGLWDGGSSDYYLYNWSPITDYTLWSPQIESMNYTSFLENDTYVLDPEWWMELSIWDGDEGKREALSTSQSEFTPERYRAFVEYGMWLVRPRVIREFRGAGARHRDILPYFEPLMKAVNDVWSSPTLSEFWRYGRLVPVPREHPYQACILNPFPWPRYFALKTDLPDPASLQSEFGVYALAIELGAAPQRRWLIYAHSPLGERAPVTVKVPGHGSVVLPAAPIEGVYYVLNEATGMVSRL